MNGQGTRYPQNPINPLFEGIKGIDREPQREQFNSLREARDQPGADQNRLAGLEHQAFNRDWVGNNPLMFPSAMLSPPLYYGAKQLGLMSGRSDPSLDQIMSGWSGAIQGLGDWWER